MKPKVFRKKPGFKKRSLGYQPAYKKVCRFCAARTRDIDYKDTKKLAGFISERGKILSARLTGNCAKHQRRLIDAIKKARFISLLPYTR